MAKTPQSFGHSECNRVKTEMVTIFRATVIIGLKFRVSCFLCPPTKGEGGWGGHIGFSADPGRQRRHDSLYPPYFVNQWGEFYQTCMDTSLGQAKELIKFLGL